MFKNFELFTLRKFTKPPKVVRGKGPWDLALSYYQISCINFIIQFACSFSGFCTNCGIRLTVRLLLEDGENICRTCITKTRCDLCKRHLDDRCMHTRCVCNNCTRKQTWRKQNGGRKHIKEVLTDETISENFGEADLIVHLQNRRQQIMDQLRATLAVFKYVRKFIL